MSAIEDLLRPILQPQGRFRLRRDSPLFEGLTLVALPNHGPRNLVSGYFGGYDGGPLLKAGPGGLELDSSMAGKNRLLLSPEFTSSSTPQSAIYDVSVLSALVITYQAAAQNFDYALGRMNGSGNPGWAVGLHSGSSNGPAAQLGSYNVGGTSGGNRRSDPTVVLLTGDGTTATVYENGAVFASGSYTAPSYDYSTFGGRAVLMGGSGVSGASQCRTSLGLFWSGRVIPPAVAALLTSPAEVWRLLVEPERIWVPVSAAGGGSTITATASLSAAVQLAQQLTAGISAAVQAPGSASASANAAVQAARSSQASLDAATQRQLSAVASLDAAVQAGSSASTSLAAAVQLARSATSALDLAVQAQRSASASVSAQVQADYAQSAAVDAYVQAGSSASTSLAAAILAQAQAQAGIDAAVQTSSQQTAGMSAALRVALQAVATVDAALQQMRSASASLSAHVQTGTSASTGFDVAVQAAAAAVVGVQAAIASAATTSLQLGAVVMVQRSVAAAMAGAVQASQASIATLSAYVQDPSILVAATWGFRVPATSRQFRVPATARSFKVR